MKTNIQKIRQMTKTVNPYGGVIFCKNEVEKMGIHKVIDKKLGKRVKQAKYKYSDVVLSWIYSMMCGSKRVEDVKKLKPYFDDIQKSQHPSPDRIGWLFKNLTTPIINYTNKDIEFEYNINKPMNELMMDVSTKLGLIKQNIGYTMDYDNVIIPCEKTDSKWSYKQCYGYCPAVSFIGKIPVYIEMQSGNTPAVYKIEESVERSLDFMEEKGIKIKRFRSDAAGYTKKMISMLDSKGVEFFLRAVRNDKTYNDLMDSGEWRKVSFGNEKHTYMMTSTKEFKQNGKNYRLILTREITEKGEGLKWDGSKSQYRSIITNNNTMSDYEVVDFYNQRGDMENNFLDLLNDWNWKRLPFSFMNENTVFMVMSAIGNIVYRHLIKTFSKKLKFVGSTFRLKKFIDRFIMIALEWIIEGEERIPLLNTSLDYSPLYGRPPSKS